MRRQPAGRVRQSVDSAVDLHGRWVGMTPFLVALAQANIRLPAGVPSGDQPVVITVGGAVSNAALIKIR